jgi:hypothetical protein
MAAVKITLLVLLGLLLLLAQHYLDIGSYFNPEKIEKYNLFSLQKFFQHGQNSNK